MAMEDEPMKSAWVAAIFVLLAAVIAVLVVRRMQPDENIWPFAAGLFLGVGLCLLWDNVVAPARARRKSHGK